MKRFLSSGIVLVTLLATWATSAQITCFKPDEQTGSSLAVSVDAVPLAHTTQVLPLNRKGEVVGKGDVSKQARQVLKNLDAILNKGKSEGGQIIKLNIYLAHSGLRGDLEKVLAAQFDGRVKPAMTFVAGAMVHPDALVTMDAVAVSRVKTKEGKPSHFPGEGKASSEVTVLPPDGVVYVAGLAASGDLAAATRETMGKIDSAITYLGLKKEDIVQLKAFVMPVSGAATVQKEIAAFFGDRTVPPVICVDWISSSVPVEIEAIVAAPKSESNQTITYHTPTGIKASPVYSRLARIHSGKRIYISGLTGKGEPINDVKEIYQQMDKALELTGSSRDHMAKATYYFSEPASNGRLDAFRPGYYNPATPPAASKARVKEVGQPGRGIVIDMIAVTK